MDPGLDELIEQVAADPQHWRPLVLTNGCFDLLHVGHVRYLSQAKALGRTLVIGLNSDRSVRTLKGPTRPVNLQAHRQEVLLALKAVDAVVIFADPTADGLITALRPDIYVKGGDYTLDKLPEAVTAARVGARVVLVPVEIQVSTTELLRRGAS
ncbi:adenylyltransferase/cytidyltransferase family protein [Candidatus Cyanaurora vandensis]|uniref:adenylyltransferase/cytidyltransferase family protein n=1 Tax=Candidatus Cyanaurora vandensis TaxID=2714958 RepID=UPI00257DC4DD|nr:adenylyltransferase/cytidyltransferase family protein [Candidatus Cyanaurora vandensis]